MTTCALKQYTTSTLYQSKRTIFVLLNIFLLTLYYTYFHIPWRGYILKEPWEKSLPGDFETCADIVKILLENTTDEGIKSTKFFSWKTPNFSELVLRNKPSKFNSDKDSLLDALCHDFYNNSTRRDATIDLTAVYPNLISLTSIDYTFFVVITNQKTIETGQNITIQIRTRDSLAGYTASGSGDFFKIRAENANTHSSVAASSIEDNGGGIYTATIQTFWSGRHDIRVFFGQSGHFIDLIKRFTSKNYGIESRFYGQFYDRGHAKNKYDLFEKQRTQCHINPSILDLSHGLCNFSAKNGEEWFCEKPSFYLCSDLYSVYSRRKQNSLKLFKLFPIHDR